MKFLSYILITLLFLQSFTVPSSEVKIKKDNTEYKANCKHSCCKEVLNQVKKDNSNKKDCCKEKCKCHHLSNNLQNAIIYNMANKLECNFFKSAKENEKLGKRNLYNYDYLENLITPPKLV